MTPLEPVKNKKALKICSVLRTLNAFMYFFLSFLATML